MTHFKAGCWNISEARLDLSVCQINACLMVVALLQDLSLGLQKLVVSWSRKVSYTWFLDSAIWEYWKCQACITSLCFLLLVFQYVEPNWPMKLLHVSLSTKWLHTLQTHVVARPETWNQKVQTDPKRWRPKKTSRNYISIASIAKKKLMFLHHKKNKHT